jgi:hypothetical protein
MSHLIEIFMLSSSGSGVEFQVKNNYNKFEQLITWCKFIYSYGIFDRNTQNARRKRKY